MRLSYIMPYINHNLGSCVLSDRDYSHDHTHGMSQSESVEVWSISLTYSITICYVHMVTMLHMHMYTVSHRFVWCVPNSPARKTFYYNQYEITGQSHLVLFAHC